MFGKNIICSNSGSLINLISLSNSPKKRIFEGSRFIMMNHQLRDKMEAFKPPLLELSSIDDAVEKELNTKKSVHMRKLKLNNNDDEYVKMNEKEKEPFVRSIDLMFPFLTGEELKVFDSLVYE